MRIKRKLDFYVNWLKWGMAYPAPSLRKKIQIMRDYLRLYHQKGITTDEYYEFSFETQTEEFRHDFLGLNEERYYLDYLNPKKFYILARNKFLAHEILKNREIRKSELYCFYEPEGRVNGEVIASTVAGVCRILQQKNVQKCVVKAAENSHGDNVVVINSIDYQNDDATLHLFNGEQLQLSDMLKDSPILFEQVLVQTEQMASLNASSVNTVRFMTALYPDGDVRIVATFIKIGRQGRCVDNAGAGGNVDACIDTATGTLQYAIQYDGLRNFHDIDTHPDSGTSLNGVKIEHWEKIVEEVKGFQRRFPYIKAAGWDIAITDVGPVVVEVNDLWDRTGQCFIRRGWRPEIRSCFLAWQKAGKKYYMGRYNNELPTKMLETIAEKESR
jgi:hypothetical protein